MSLVDSERGGLYGVRGGQRRSIQAVRTLRLNESSRWLGWKWSHDRLNRCRSILEDEHCAHPRFRGRHDMILDRCILDGRRSLFYLLEEILTHGVQQAARQAPSSESLVSLPSRTILAHSQVTRLRAMPTGPMRYTRHQTPFLRTSSTRGTNSP